MKLITYYWGAWVLAVKLTEPKSAPVVGATGDQRA